LEFPRLKRFFITVRKKKVKKCRKLTIIGISRGLRRRESTLIEKSLNRGGVDIFWNYALL